MADNKRIYQLDPTSDPAGKLFPLDASGLSKALAITFENLEKAISPVISRVLTPDDPTAAAANTAAIAAALAEYAQSGNRKGVMRLPRGKFWLASAIVVAAAHSGLTIDADGCTLLTDNSSSIFPLNTLLTIGAATGTDPAGFFEGFGFDAAFPNRLAFDPLRPLDPNYRVGDAILLFIADNYITIQQPVQQMAVITGVDTDLKFVFIDAPVRDELRPLAR